MADSGKLPTLTARQYNLIGALLTEATVRKAAEKAAVPERTAFLWLKDPIFVAEYRLARREATSQAIARLQQFSALLAGELVRLATSARSEAVRLGAVSKGLDLAIKSVELDDLAARLDALEAKYAERI
jgi:hypothetical protein